MKKIKLILFGIILCQYSVSAQESWSLEKCIQYAQNKSLTIQQSQLAISTNKISLEQNKMSRYPTVNANSSYSINSGRTVNFNQDIVTQTTFSNNLSLNAGVALYQGGRVKNTIKQNKLDIESSKLDLEQTSRDIALQVAQSYLQILLTEEQLQATKGQLKQTEDQLKQTNKLINAGVLAPNNRLDIEAQIARNEQNVIAAQNAVTLSYLTLKQLMTLDIEKEIRIYRPQLEIDDSTLKNVNIRNIYSQAISKQPNVKAGELRVQSAELGEAVAAASKKISITLSGNITTGYFSSAKEIVDYENITVAQPFTVDLGTGPVTGTLDFIQSSPNLRNQPYLSQLNQNLGENIGINISYPIWDNNVAKLNKERARLNKENIRIQNNLLKQRLRVDIQNAYTNALAAKNSHNAAKRSLIAQEAAYQNTKRQYDLGSANAFQLSTARNSRDLSNTELIRSKYDYIFRLKILDFYAGKAIKL